MQKKIALKVCKWLLPFVFPLLMFLLIILCALYDDSNNNEVPTPLPNQALSAECEAYRPLVVKYCNEYGIPDQVDVIMAIMMQESGGRVPDVMQSSESIGLPPNLITDPEESIKYGVQHYKSIMDSIPSKDQNAIIQGYNYGGAWAGFVNERGGIWTPELAVEFSNIWASKYGWDSYGDKDYVPHVIRYLPQYPHGDGTQIFDYDQVHTIMRQYLGVPYLFGGKDPTTGGIDCSGLMEYSFAQVGINLSGNAQMQYDMTEPVAEKDAVPGDLVFFTTYKAGASHVGMYVGNDQFLNANNNGVEYSSITTWKELYPFLGYRRVVHY